MFLYYKMIESIRQRPQLRFFFGETEKLLVFLVFSLDDLKYYVTLLQEYQKCNFMLYVHSITIFLGSSLPKKCGWLILNSSHF